MLLSLDDGGRVGPAEGAVNGWVQILDAVYA
jgi:hypothetical protein